MNKATLTSLKEMEEAQIKRDISMTPEERLDFAFQLSDFALKLGTKRRVNEDPSIQWIELRFIKKA